MNRMIRAVFRVVLGQPLAQPVNLNPNNGILFLIELRRPPQRIDRDAVLLDLARGALEGLFANVGQDLRQTRRAIENSRS